MTRCEGKVENPYASRAYRAGVSGRWAGQSTHVDLNRRCKLPASVEVDGVHLCAAHARAKAKR